METRSKHLICKAVFLTVFFSIAFYGGSEPWFEALVFSAIFVFSAVALWQGSFARIIGRNKSLFLPVILLAAFSFIQAFSTLLIEYEFLPNSFLLPYSFDLTASLRSGLKLFAFACFIGLFVESLRRDFHFSIWSLIGAGNFFALAGIARFVVQSKFPDALPAFILPELTPGVGFGTFVNQNHFALLMLMTFGLNAGFCWLGKFDKRRRSFLLVLSLISWTAIVLTMSRGGIVGSFVVIGALVVCSSLKPARRSAKRKKGGKLLAAGEILLIFAFISAVLVIGVVLIGQDDVLHRFDEIPDEIEKVEASQAFRRIDAWQAGAEIARENWLYGVGFGGYRYAVSRFIDISGRLAPQQAHNDYLEFINSGGLIAVFLAAWFLYRFFLVLKERFGEPANNFESTARVGAVCGLAGVGLHSFFDFGLQFTGNLLFFAALLAIAIYSPAMTRRQSRSGKDLSALSRTVSTVLLVLLAFGAAYFAWARFDLEQAKNGAGENFIENSFIRMPFDAGYFEARADIFSGRENFRQAAEELKTAVFYRPEDYLLWLKLARLEEALNNSESSENALRQAIKLAPLYGEPHFDYGNFLIRNKRTEEGFRELAFASRRDARFSDRVIETIWQKTGEDISRTHDLLAPLSDTAESGLAGFLMKRNAFSAVVKLECLSEFSPYLQSMLVIQLLEKKQFQSAWRIYRTGCAADEERFPGVIDGGFEDGELRKGIGFGWRIGDAVERKNLFFDEENRVAGKQSLRFTLDGDFKTPLISQIVPVEKDALYRLSFSYKIAELTTGAAPVAQIIHKQPAAEDRFEEIELKAVNGEWIGEQREFRTNSATEAVEIRFSTRACGQQICPVFGKLWLDEFALFRAEK